nr:MULTISPECIES: ATPase domain-containing protein [unclassified Nitratiruptor]
MTTAIKEAVEKYKPTRVVIDSLTQFRYLSTDIFQFRKEVLSLLNYLSENGATTLFTSESSHETPDDDLRFLSDGVIDLFVTEEYRYLMVKKFRGSEFISGTHTYEIKNNKGITVYPRLSFKGIKSNIEHFKQFSFGVPEIDELLFGGIEQSTISVIAGPSGTGKTTLSMQFLKECAGRGERSIVYSFEEQPEKIIERCEKINIPVKAMIEQGTLKIKYIPPNIYTNDAFAEIVKKDIEEKGTKIVMIDSTSGYIEAMIGKNNLTYLFNLCKYLSLHKITVLLPTEVKNITGDFLVSNYDISYIADNIIFLRYLEIKGQLRRAIGILKKRLSNFEKTLREFEITKYGIKVGTPLYNLENILTGVPKLVSEKD